MPPKTPIQVLRQRLDLELGGNVVPSIYLIPQVEHRVAAALLIHGYSSTKERLADTMGRALAMRGMASLAIDLPLHGTRDDELTAQARRNPLQLVKHWRTALAEARDAIGWLLADQRIDSGRVAVIGYSLGGYLALETAARVKPVSAVVLAASGDLPDSPWIRMMRKVADPIAAAKSLDGRPLLMLHGRTDRTIEPAQAERLFAAAREPKQLIWYDAGHVLPPAAAETAAEWLRTR